MSTEDQLPAELRVTPTTEPTLEIDPGAHVPPEAAVVALTHDEGTAAAPPGGRGTADVPYEALAAAEAAGERAAPTPAEMRVAPVPEPEVHVGEWAHVPPEAGVVPLVHRDDDPDPRT
jgi:hypothetical protein